MCCRGLRSVHAYILVYDICCFDSFEYIKTIRQQILETRYTPLCRGVGPAAAPGGAVQLAPGFPCSWHPR